MLPGQCFVTPGFLGQVSEAQACVKQLQAQSSTITNMPLPPSSEGIFNNQWFACNLPSDTGRKFHARVLLNSTCKQKVTNGQVAATVQRIINTCNKNGRVGGIDYLDGNDQVMVEVSVP